MVSWSEIITENAMLAIEDVRLEEELIANPALFLRKMAMYVKNAVGKLNRPPELYGYILKGMTEPQFDDCVIIGHEGETEFHTDKFGYELCVATNSEDGSIIDATYDAETGILTLAEALEQDARLDIDFYKDGELPDMSYRVREMFGMAIALTWDERFSRNWLNLQPKIKDASFDVVNEANYIEKSSKRLVENKQAFHDMLRKFEQDIAYFENVGKTSAYLFGYKEDEKVVEE